MLTCLPSGDHRPLEPLAAVTISSATLLGWQAKSAEHKAAIMCYPHREKPAQSFLPALRFHKLTPYYDALLSLSLHDSSFKRQLVAQAQLAPTHRILDLGCGTGTLTLMLHDAAPGSQISALDIDPMMLESLRARLRRASIRFSSHENPAITIQQGNALTPPYAAGAFDRIISCLFFHHLERREKLRVLEACYRLLKPNGQLHIADWGTPTNWLRRIAFLGPQLLDGFSTTRDHAAGRLPAFIADAGFKIASEYSRHETLFGTISLIKAIR